MGVLGRASPDVSIIKVTVRCTTSVFLLTFVLLLVLTALDRLAVRLHVLRFEAMSYVLALILIVIGSPAKPVSSECRAMGY